MVTAARQTINRQNWLSVAEAAQLTGYNEEYIRQLARTGAIEAQKLVRSTLILRSSLLAYKQGMDAIGTRRFSKAHAAKPKRAGADSTARPFTGVVDTVPTLNIGAQQLRTRNEGARRLLVEWAAASDESAADQQDTLDFLVTALDEDRSSRRRLFPGKDRVETEDAPRS